MSTGIFMSFLFEQFWGVIDRKGGRSTVRALRNWEHDVTVTDVSDIGRILSRVVAGDVEAENPVIYAAGDTVTYKELADIIERVIGEPVEREVWSVSYLKTELAKDPIDQIKRYRPVFTRDGVCWDKSRTVNHKLGMSVIGIDEYARKLISQ